MYCDTDQLPTLPFFGSYTKPHGSRGWSNHYHLLFDPNLGHGVCAILRIPCACVGCTSILDKPWISGIQSTKQACYQPVIKCTYWPVLVSYNNCNIIDITQKSIPSEAFDEIHKIVIDRIGENMASLFQAGMYGAINTEYNTSNVSYVIQFVSQAYTLQNNTTIDGQVISAGGVVVKSQYLCSMQENTNWYWKKQPLQHTIIVPTRTILHPRLDFITIRYFQYIPKNVCSSIQVNKSIQRHPISMTDADYDSILDEIECHEKIEFERNVSVNSDDEYYL